MKAVVLGILSSKPAKDLHTASAILQYEGEAFLFDACEGCQSQIMKSTISYMKINYIFISHFHADHFLGLPGVIATMQMSDRKKDLYIFGPKGIRKKVEGILELFNIKPSFRIIAKEIKEGVILDKERYFVKAKKLKHSLSCYGFLFKEKDIVGKFNREKAELLLPPSKLYKKLQKGESVLWKGKLIKAEDVMDYSYVKKGRSFAYLVDFKDSNYEDFIKDVSLLFHEGCFLKKDENLAKKTLHSVIEDVICIAKKANVKKLVLFNYSNRYIDDLPSIKKKLSSENVVFADELDSFEVLL